MMEKSRKEAYQAPEVSIIDISAEGVLCQSAADGNPQNINIIPWFENETINGNWS